MWCQVLSLFFNCGKNKHNTKVTSCTGFKWTGPWHAVHSPLCTHRHHPSPGLFSPGKTELCTHQTTPPQGLCWIKNTEASGHKTTFLWKQSWASGCLGILPPAITIFTLQMCKLRLSDLSSKKKKKDQSVAAQTVWKNSLQDALPSQGPWVALAQTSGTSL